MMNSKLKIQINKFINTVYLLFLFRFIVLFSNGYSDRTARWMIQINLITCVVLFFLIFFKTKRYNLYIITGITAILIFGLKYSTFNNRNIEVNINTIKIYVSFLILSMLLFGYQRYIKRKKHWKILLLFISFFSIKPFVEYYYHYYSNPKNVIYEMEITNIKDTKEMLEIISKLPLVNIVRYEDKNGRVIAFPNTDLTRTGFTLQTNMKKENESMILVSTETYISYESADSLANEIKKYLTLIGKSKERVRLHIVTLKSREFPIKIYEIQYGQIKEIFKLKNIRESEDVFKIIFLIPSIFIGQRY